MRSGAALMKKPAPIAILSTNDCDVAPGQSAKATQVAANAKQVTPANT